MYLSNTVWASFGDSSVLCKETISIASHCFYSWFLANTHNMNCTEFRASLSITRNQNNNSHHYLYFLLFWQQFTWGNGTLRSLFCYCLFFFFFLVVEKLGNICPCCNQWVCQWSQWSHHFTKCICIETLSSKQIHQHRYLCLWKTSTSDPQKVFFVSRLF